MSDVLAFSGVSVVRGGNTLLADISWEVEEGQRWVILGPNGAGKTTLLQLAAARIHPSDGVVGILGEVLGAVDVFELRPRIGLASASIAERIPGGERVVDVVVTASYAVVGRWREEYDALDLARAQGLLGSMGVGHLANRSFGTLSEGERKRVQIARALMTDPELMLLDEPAAGLDLGGREDLVARLSALAEDVDAPVLVLVTHHVEEIPPGFTDVLLLREGRVVAAGPLELTLTAANLSATFGLPLALDRHGARWSARAADAGGPDTPRGRADPGLAQDTLAADLAASYAGTEAHR
jgi:iron complex transport system ATP-binding protein